MVKFPFSLGFFCGGLDLGWLTSMIADGGAWARFQWLLIVVGGWLLCGYAGYMVSFSVNVVVVAGYVGLLIVWVYWRK